MNPFSVCKAWTYVVRGSPSGSGDCCLKGSIPCPKGGSSTCTSGAKTATTLPQCGGGAGGNAVSCTVDYTPNTNTSAPYYEVPVSCGAHKDTLRLLPSEKTVEIRVYTDVTFTETFFQGGRVAITTTGATDNSSTVTLTSTTAATAASATVYVHV